MKLYLNSKRQWTRVQPSHCQIYLYVNIMAKVVQLIKNVLLNCLNGGSSCPVRTQWPSMDALWWIKTQSNLWKYSDYVLTLNQTTLKYYMMLQLCNIKESASIETRRLLCNINWSLLIWTRHLRVQKLVICNKARV